MLSKFWLGNFIHFKDQEYFKFNEGLNILLGPNHTGKTSVFEAIRRCMSVKLNGGLSNVYDAERISYVISKFESKGNGELGRRVIWSSIIRIKTDVDDSSKLVTLKLVRIVNDQDKEEEKAIDIVDHKDKDLVNKQLACDQFDFTILDKVEALREKERNEKSLTEAINDYEKRFEEIVRQYLKKAVVKDQLHIFFTTDQKKINDTSSETILQKHIDAEAVVIFPFRSFAVHQWTRSKRDMERVMNKEKANVNYDEITLKKEIICWYLSKTSSVKTKRIEEKYFDLISGNSMFKFQLLGGHVQVYVGDDPYTGTLLKVPEGIYEAKSAAIVLADPQFKTICLDDAERGMHPQMIERFRDLVLQDIDDKVVLVITHHPTFLAPWNISKTFYFQKRADGVRYQFSVKPLKCYAEQIGGKGPQIITSGQFPSLFFAERICWVEGKTEYLFMTALKYLLVRKKSPVLKSYCGKDKEQKKRFRDFLSTLHIVSMDGEAGKCLFREISQALELTHYFILDFDALERNLKKPSTQVSDAQQQTSSGCDGRKSSPKDICKTFCDAFGVQLHADRIKYIKTTNDIVKCLQDHGIFVWKLTNEDNHSSGTIEHAVKRLTVHNHKLGSFLKEKKIEIVPKKKKNPNKFKKLFHDQNITNKDITDGVEGLLYPNKDGAATKSSSNDDDFYRLVTFLMERCNDETFDKHELVPVTDVSECKKRRIDTDQEQTMAVASGSGYDGN